MNKKFAEVSFRSFVGRGQAWRDPISGGGKKVLEWGKSSGRWRDEGIRGRRLMEDSAARGTIKNWFVNFKSWRRIRKPSEMRH